VEYVKPEPTWIAPFARRLLSTIQLEDPIRFFPTDLKNGEYYVEKDEGVEGCFYWTTREGEIEIHLYEYQDATYLDYDDLFPMFLKVRPEVENLLNEYKEFAKQYILSANQLLLSIITDGKEKILDKVSNMVKDTEVIRLFRDQPASARELPLHYSVEGKDILLRIRQDFFTTAYSEAIVKVGRRSGHYTGGVGRRVRFQG
jgi:hypothetical protein